MEKMRKNEGFFVVETLGKCCETERDMWSVHLNRCRFINKVTMGSRSLHHGKWGLMCLCY